MKLSFVLLLNCFLLLSSVGKSQVFNYGTESKIALEHYQKGWEYIMDLGEWTKAEASFRKAVMADSEFLLAWVQVGRISNEPKERDSIFTLLKEMQHLLGPQEKKILSPYLMSMEIIDLKDKNQTIPKEKISDFYQNSLVIFSDFLMEYPDEVYVFAEYIETIHGIYGAQPALDRINKSNKIYQGLPFILSYKGILEAETGQEKLAWKSFNKFKASFHGQHFPPSVFFTEAKISNLLGDNKRAEKAIKKTLELDPKHTLAKRLKGQFAAL